MDLLSVAQLAAAIATAGATIVLCWFTGVLARETRNLSEASSAPFVVATIEANPWSIRHCDLVIENTGNAAAFDVKISVDPPLPCDKPRENEELPFSEISAMRPSQRLTTYVCEYKSAKDSRYVFTISWARKPGSVPRESICYAFNMIYMDHRVRLGAESAGHQIAEQVKLLREDWKFVAHGQRKIEVDAYLGPDRAKARDEAIRIRAEMNREDSGETGIRAKDPD